MHTSESQPSQGMRHAKRLDAHLWVALGAVFSLALGSALPAHAQPHTQIFNDGNAAFFRGDYRGATQRYGQLVALGFEDPTLTFNLAVSYARLGMYGRAVQFFERTIEVSPGDEDAIRGAALARAVLAKRRAEHTGEGTVASDVSLLRAFSRVLAKPTWALLLVISNFLFFALLIVRRFLVAETHRTATGIALALAFVMLLLSSVGLAAKSRLFAIGHEAIIVQDLAQVREGPDPRARVTGQAYEGDLVHILSRAGNYYLVRMPNGRQSWLSIRDVGAI